MTCHFRCVRIAGFQLSHESGSKRSLFDLLAVRFCDIAIPANDFHTFYIGNCLLNFRNERTDMLRLEPKLQVSWTPVRSH